MRTSTFLPALLCCALLAGPALNAQVSAAEPWTLTTVEQENKLGAEAYQDILKNEKVNKDPEINAVVRRVAERIAQAAPDKGFKYEVVVLESDKVNAFCLPGGKIAVYTGILPYCQNEAGLATVMGHEVAHAILRHGGQRMTQQTVVGVVGAGVQKALEVAEIGDTTSKVALGAYGYGTQLGILLPYGRDHEREADLHGLNYMAKAGYDPAEAPAFWKRFSILKSDVPSFLSTHPANEERSTRLANAQDDVRKLYANSPKYGRGVILPARYIKGVKGLPPPTGDAPGVEVDTAHPGLKAFEIPYVDAAIKDLLSVASNRAVGELGQAGGYRKDKKVRVSFPEHLKPVAAALHDKNKDEPIRKLVLGLNQTAEKALPRLQPLLLRTIKSLRIAHPKRVASGGPDAASRALLDAASQHLIRHSMPTLRQTAEETGVREAYEKLVKHGGPKTAEAAKNFNLEVYLAQTMLEGYFRKLMEAEQKMRAQPEKEQDERIRRVFGAIR